MNKAALGTVIGLVAAWLSVTTALAAGPVFVASPIVNATIPFGACDGFTINALFSADRRNANYFDDQGNFVLQRRQVAFSGELYNVSDPANRVPYGGHFTRTQDSAAGTLVFHGLRWKVVIPGEGVVSMNTGTEVIDLESDTPVFKSGPSGDLAQLCEALS